MSKTNGRRIRPNQIASELEKAMAQKAAESIRNKVSHVRCRAHGQPARVLVRGRSLKDMAFDVSGCCDELIEEVKRKLR